MHAYAVRADFNLEFADHDWAKKNLKEEGEPNDFSTLWHYPNASYDLTNYNTAVYFYGGRNAIYKALQKYGSALIVNQVKGHMDDPIHVFGAPVEVDHNKHKQIIMLAVADSDRDDELADFRYARLECVHTGPHSERPPRYVQYKMADFRANMKLMWPDIG